jgi:thiol-disulfide isomerase/thioredoxin
MRSFIIISAFFTLITFSSAGLPILNSGRLVITGQITNAKTKTISVISIELTGREKHSFKLDEAGRFYFAIDVLSPHDNYLIYNNKLLTFFAYPNDSIYIEVDGNDFRNTIKFSGERAKFNQCLSIFFSDFGNFLEENRYFGRQKPYDFLAVTNKLKNYMNEKIDSISRNMKPEKAAIDWMYSYIKYKAAEELFQYGRNYKGELPQDYYDFVDELEEQKIEDLKCSQYYEDFIQEYYHLYKRSGFEERFVESGNKISNGSISAGISIYFDIINEFATSKIPKELILTKSYVHFIRKYPNTVDSLYQKYTQLVSNQEYQRFIKQQLDIKRIVVVEQKTIDDLIKLEYIGEIFSELKEIHKNKIIYIDLWGTWCKACIMQFHFSNELHERLKNKPIEFVYLCCKSKKDKWQDGIEKYKLQGTHYLLTQDQYSVFSSEFNFTGLPRYMIIDKNGNIVNDNAQGPNNVNLYSELSELVDQ